MQDLSLDLILVIVADFLLPIMTEANSEIATLLIQKIAENQSPKKALEAAQYLIDKINIYALPSTRSTWRYAVASELKIWGFELQDINLELADIKSPQGELSSNFLKLKDGSVLSKYEVGLIVISISHLQELLECESDDSYFNWASAITSLVREAGK